MAPEDKPKWYFDACVLEDGRPALSVLLNTGGKEMLTSFLAIGEALGNCHNKGQGKADAFHMLLKSLEGRITIRSNDLDFWEVLRAVHDTCPRLTIADALHLAFALNEKCERMFSDDEDLYSLPRETLRQLAERFSYPSPASFEVVHVAPRAKKAKRFRHH